MGRRIVTRQLHSAGGGGDEPDTKWADKVVKYIPADVVAGWTGAHALIVASNKADYTVLWIVFLVFVGLTVFWVWKNTSQPGAPPAKTQILVSTISFVVWVFALGGPFTQLEFYMSRPYIGGLVLLIWTIIAGFINPTEPGGAAPAAQPVPPA